MPKPRKLQPQSVWDAAAVHSAFKVADIKNAEAQASRLWGHLIRNPSSSWHDVPNFPKAACSVLDAGFVKFTSKLHAVQRSTDGDTMKLLLSLQDGLRIESVVMQYDTSKNARNSEIDGEHGNVRCTLCVSSQVGCQMGCTFCATGTMGLIANLTAGEIVEQLAFALQFTKIRNIVFMGMGEPLHNYECVKSAVQMMIDSRYFSLSARHVTLSTVGVVNRILDLADDLPTVSFALSLHAPTQELRQQIVPSAKAYKLDKLVAAVKEYQRKTGQKVFVEYVMLRDVNDGEQQARELGALLTGMAVTVNLIPWNPVLSPDMHFDAPGPERLQAFQMVLREEFDMHCTVRQEKGQEISGACGQLVIDHAGSRSKGLGDIEEVAARLMCKS